MSIRRKICDRFVLKQLKLGEREFHVHIKLKMFETFEICHLGADKNNLEKNLYRNHSIYPRVENKLGNEFDNRMKRKYTAYVSQLVEQ